MKRIINYIATHYIDLIAYCALFDAITAPFLLHLDVNTYNSLYTIWLLLYLLQSKSINLEIRHYVLKYVWD